MAIVKSLEGAMSDNRHGKMETYYGPMIYGGYPLLYAMMLDIRSSNPTSVNRVSSGSFSQQISNSSYTERPQRVAVILEAAHISLLPTPYKESFMVSASEGGVSMFKYNAATEDDLKVFTGGHKKLIASLNACFNNDSYTQQVMRQLRLAHPELDPAFMLQSARRAVLDGFLSTYEAAVHLSRSPIEGITEETRQRLLRILRSNAPTELTKKLKASVLTNLASLPYTPARTTRIVDGQVLLHPDMVAFTNVANAELETKVPYPMLCPFAIPLGNRVEDALAYFGGEQNLPIEVVQMMRQNNLVPGINSAGMAIADVLEKPSLSIFSLIRRSSARN